jgi:hypothetical protein
MRYTGRAERWLTTIAGLRFRGSILPAVDSVSPTQLIETRLLLRTRPNEPIVEGTNVTDADGRVFLLGRDDVQHKLAKTFRMFRMEKLATWERVTSTNDPVTNQPMRTGWQELGPIWCALEILSNLVDDRGSHMTAEKRHVVTGYPILLQDKVDGNIVRRVTPTFGIYVCEIE